MIAVKIIKEGKLPKPKIEKLHGICVRCGCEFETDVTNSNIGAYSRSDPTFVLKCPTDGCNNYVRLTRIYEN